MPHSVSPILPQRAAIGLHWACLSNFGHDKAFSARLTLSNQTGAPIAAGWSIFFNTCRKTIPGSVTAPFSIEHVNGDLFRLRAPGLADWPAGVTLTVDYQAQFWAISITDAPLGFYMTAADGAVLDLGDPQIAPFDAPRNRQRGPGDQTPLQDAAARYADNANVPVLPLAQVGRLTPSPVTSRFEDSTARLSRTTSIVFSQGLAAEAALLRAVLDALPEGEGDIARIVLDTGAIDGNLLAGPAPNEAYQLEITAASICIRGGGAHGVFNGIQSLRQLIEGSSVPLGRVSDSPRFAYRGMMLDVARHFADKETVLRLLDCMALYKLNRFHFHLTDDEGWRFPVPALPELTEVGARRGVGEHCLPPSFGSGAKVEGSAGTGYYSAADFIEIIRYAHARHIEVIPEFNVPGHARAAIVAMRARQARLRAAGDLAGADACLLDDADDRSVYESVQLWHDNVICIALPSVDRFFETVVLALADLYAQAGVPLRTVHTGGDEVPAGAWLHSPICQALMAERGWTALSQLRGDFVARCHAILARHGIAYAGWEETALEHAGASTAAARLAPSARFAGAGFHVYAWNNAWGWGQEDIAYQLANAGYQVVLSNAASLYFDLAYAKDGAEPGYYWAGFVGTRDAFSFCPLDSGATAGVEPMGGPVPAALLAGMQKLDGAGAARIAGLQGQLWGENANSRERIEYLAAPRLIALAERAWSPDPGWERLAPRERATAVAAAWGEFANRLGRRVLPRLDAALAYGYRLPPPGAIRQSVAGVTTVFANIALPGLALHYTVDGSAPQPHSPAYAGPVARPAGARHFNIAAFDTRGRASRSVTIDLETERDE